MRILAQDTIAVIIDIQEKLLPVIHRKEEVLINTQKLLKGLKVLSVPVVVTEQYPKGLGKTVEEIFELTGEGIEKMTFSGWETEAIREAICASGKKNVILAGIEAHVCVLQTAIDLLANGYQVTLVSDCIGSRNESDWRGALSRCKQEGGIVTTFEALLFELLRQAGSAEFKEISKIVK